MRFPIIDYGNKLATTVRASPGRRVPPPGFCCLETVTIRRRSCLNTWEPVSRRDRSRAEHVVTLFVRDVGRICAERERVKNGKNRRHVEFRQSRTTRDRPVKVSGRRGQFCAPGEQKKPSYLSSTLEEYETRRAAILLLRLRNIIDAGHRRTEQSSVPHPLHSRTLTADNGSARVTVITIMTIITRSEYMYTHYKCRDDIILH